jgi:hypothetical protein
VQSRQHGVGSKRCEPAWTKVGESASENSRVQLRQHGMGSKRCKPTEARYSCAWGVQV